MIIALLIAVITADTAQMLHARLWETGFSFIRAVLYFIFINAAFICYMLLYRQETFSMNAYYYAPRAVLRYTACALGLCMAAPLIFTALKSPKLILSAVKRSVWLTVSMALILVLSAGAFLTYKNTEAISPAIETPAYSEPAGP